MVVITDCIILGEEKGKFIISTNVLTCRGDKTQIELFIAGVRGLGSIPALAAG
jgi:hypothetical protein